MLFVPLVTLFLAAYAKGSPSEDLPFSNRRTVGDIVKVGELRYQLGFWLDDKVPCGASLIYPMWALTAAHCVQGRDPRDIFVLAAQTYEPSRHQGGGHVQRRGVWKIIIHEEYNLRPVRPEDQEDEDSNYPPTFVNDIAILKLEAPMIINKWVKTIPMANATHKAKGSFLVTGWGDPKFKENEEKKELMKVTLPLVENSKCAEAYKTKKPFTITEKHICAGFLGVGGKNSCQGDSGSPLVEETGNTSVLVGVASAGFDCTLGKYPGVFSSVAAYRPWIDAQMNKCIVDINCK